MDNFLAKTEEASVEYEDYRAEYKKLKESQKSTGQKKKEEMVKSIHKDLQEDASLCSVKRAIRCVCHNFSILLFMYIFWGKGRYNIIKFVSAEVVTGERNWVIAIFMTQMRHQKSK